jgi:hypothetical protein
MNFIGTWHITEMEMWDESYFNMEVQAFIQIKGVYSGHFQFGLVSGQLDGEVEREGNEEQFLFTWDGVDEMDPVSGSGWLRLINPNEIEGKIKFHQGDSSTFQAKRAA